MEKKYLTTTEIMDYLNISKSTLFRYIKQGMPVLRVSTKKNLFEREEIDQWLRLPKQ